MKQLEIFILPLDGMLVCCRVTPALEKYTYIMIFIHLGGGRYSEFPLTHRCVSYTHKKLKERKVFLKNVSLGCRRKVPKI